MENQLRVIVKESGLDATKAEYILNQFQNYFELAAEWEKKAKTLVVTNESQRTEMQMAKTARLFLREKRIAVEDSRKRLKEQCLREGKAIDGIANVLKALIIPIEEYLDKQEKFVEHREAAKAEIIRIEVEKKMEEDRIAAEQAAIAEQARIKAENERLRKEAEEKEKALQAERAKVETERKEAERKAREAQEKLRKEAEEKAEKISKENDAKLAKEREEANEKIQEALDKIEKVKIELRQKKDAEEKAKREAEEKIEAQKNAGDREKLLFLAESIEAIKFPEIKDTKNYLCLEEVKSLLYLAITKIQEVIKTKKES